MMEMIMMVITMIKIMIIPTMSIMIIIIRKVQVSEHKATWQAEKHACGIVAMIVIVKRTTTSTYTYGFLCTMQSLQCNCACELFAHPWGWSGATLSTNVLLKRRLKVWLNSRNLWLSILYQSRLHSADQAGPQ